MTRSLRLRHSHCKATTPAPPLAHKWGTGQGSSLGEMLGRVSMGATVAARWIWQGIAVNALAVLHDVHFESKAHPTASELQQGKSVLGMR